MRRIHILIAALAVAAILVPSASAAGPFPYPHPRNADAMQTTDTSWAVVAATLAGFALIVGAATVLPRRPRQCVAV
jgi:hypothetical protein